MSLEKYLKYKIKYLNLKKNITGGAKKIDLSKKKSLRGCNKPGNYCIDKEDDGCKTSKTGIESSNCICSPGGNCIKNMNEKEKNKFTSIVGDLHNNILKIEVMLEKLEELENNISETKVILEKLKKLENEDYNISTILNKFSQFQKSFYDHHQFIKRIKKEIKDESKVEDKSEKEASKVEAESKEEEDE